MDLIFRVLSTGTYFCNEEAVPLPDSLKEKDLRGDPVTKVAVLAAEAAVSKVSIGQRESFGVVAISSEGCISHIAKVVDGIKRKLPRPAYFARAGAQTISTYVAMALDIHGPTFAMKGNLEALRDAFRLSSYLIQNDMAEQICIVVADYYGQSKGAISMIIDHEFTSGIQLKITPEYFLNSSHTNLLSCMERLSHTFQELSCDNCISVSHNQTKKLAIEVFDGAFMIRGSSHNEKRNIN